MELQNRNDQQAIHSFLMKIYFKECNILASDEYDLMLKYRDNNWLKWIGLPKRFYRTYELTAIHQTTNKRTRTRLPFRDKDSVKYLVNIITKKN
jgi:hypothetical protein